MDLFTIAYTTVFTTPAIFAALGGVTWGMIGGALPGISASIAMAMLLPFTFSMDPTTALIMLISVYVGAEYGGAIPAILIRTPGTSAAAATAIDGYIMHKAGRGGEALGLSLVAGVIGGFIGIVLTVFLTEPLARLALLFTPAAYFSLGVLGLSVIASLTGRSVVKGYLAGLLGFAVATVGSDPQTGVMRFTFDQPELMGGIAPIFALIGVFAISELMEQVTLPEWEKTDRQTRIVLPSWKMLRRCSRAMGIGSGIGAFEGAMPGAGGTIASFMSYNEARRWSKTPEEFGKGSPEAIAAPEAANNTVTATVLVPTLAFGVPGSNSAAVLLGGLLMHGLVPGPMLFENHSNLVYGLFTGLFLANLLQLPLGFAIMNPAIWMVNRPKPWLLAFIFAFVVSGVYTVEGQVFDIGIVLVAGIMGYTLRYFDFPFLPLVLGVILGHLVESNYRRALQVSGGDHVVFVDDPASLTLLVVAALLVAMSMWRNHTQVRKEEQAGEVSE